MSDKEDNNKPSSTSDKNNSQSLFELFEQIAELPRSEHDDFINANCDSKDMENQLRKMILAAESTYSMFDTPIGSKAELTAKWNPLEYVDSTLDDINIVDLIHAGSIASVYRGRQLEPMVRDVAVKLIHPNAPEKFINRFRIEQATLAKLIHPNIATIHSVGETNEGLPYLIMEHIEGDMLMPHCNNNQLTIDERLNLLLEVCDAISFSHQRNILHRDIKSSNIMIRKFENRDVPLVIDFGISKDNNAELTNADGESLGTPEYMSPEHFQDIAEMDVRSDVYSLGMVLYTLLAGKIPFDRSTFLSSDFTSRKAMILELKPEKPSVIFKQESAENRRTLAKQRGVSEQKLTRQLTHDLDNIYLKATSKNINDRYGSVTDLANDIRAYLNNLPVQATNDSSWYVAKKFIQRNAIGVAIASLIFASILVFSGAIYQKNIRIGDLLAISQSETKKAKRERDLAVTTNELVLHLLSTGRDGKRDLKDSLDYAQKYITEFKTIDPYVKYRILLEIGKLYDLNKNGDKAKEVIKIIRERDNLSSESIDKQLELFSAENKFETTTKIDNEFIRKVIELNKKGELEPSVVLNAYRVKTYIDALENRWPEVVQTLIEHVAFVEAQYGKDSHHLIYPIRTLALSPHVRPDMKIDPEPYIQRGLALMDQHYSLSHPIYSNFLQSLAFLKRQKGDTQGALLIESRLISTLGSSTLEKMRIEAFAYIEEDPDRAIKISNNMVEILLEKYDEFSLPVITQKTTHAHLLGRAGRPDEAYKYIEEIRPIILTKKIDHMGFADRTKRLQIAMYNDLIHYSVQAKNFELAQENALELLSFVDDKGRYWRFHANLSLCFVAATSGDYGSAIKHHDVAKKLYQRMKWTRKAIEKKETAKLLQACQIYTDAKIVKDKKLSTEDIEYIQSSLTPLYAVGLYGEIIRENWLVDSNE